MIENLTPWKPGQSGNPGGMTREMRALIAENAEKATRIRAAWLDAEIARIEAGQVPDLDTERLSLVKSSEDRGLGAPKQTTELEGGLSVTKITRRILRE